MDISGSSVDTSSSSFSSSSSLSFSSSPGLIFEVEPRITGLKSNKDFLAEKREPVSGLGASFSGVELDDSGTFLRLWPLTTIRLGLAEGELEPPRDRKLALVAANREAIGGCREVELDKVVVVSDATVVVVVDSVLAVSLAVEEDSSEDVDVASVEVVVELK